MATGKCGQCERALTRRDLLRKSGMGFGALALSALLAEEAEARAPGQGAGGTGHGVRTRTPNPLAPRAPHFPPRAKAVIFLYRVGGPSHIETFDPKPELDRLDGQQMPSSFGEIKSQFLEKGTPLMRSAW